MLGGSISLGKKLKISLFAIGVVVVAAGTSLPELASCVRSVASNHPDIATGAIIGSNIANIILIMGATALLCPIRKITQNQVNQAAIKCYHCTWINNDEFAYDAIQFCLWCFHTYSINS